MVSWLREREEVECRGWGEAERRGREVLYTNKNNMCYRISFIILYLYAYNLVYTCIK